jgi:hypothetical protein
MLSRIFPKQLDNDYRGSWVAVWLFVPVLLMKLAIAVNISGLNPWVSNRYVLEAADGIPLDTFGAEAASTLVFFAASWGLATLVLNLFGVAALIRYRAMIPLMYLLLSIEHFGRKALLLINPSVRAAATAGTEGIPTGVLINWGIMAALVVGLVLSLRDSSSSR